MTPRTIGFLVILTLSFLVVPLAAEAQPATKVHRIGYLIAGSSPAGPDPRLHDFRQELRDLGYVEGQNLIIEPRYAEGSDARLRDLAAELVRLQVEVIVAGGSAATRAAQQATRTIPIVMASSGNPGGLGFVASLAQPRGAYHGREQFCRRAPRQAAGTPQGSGAAEHAHRRVDESSRAIPWARDGTSGGGR